MTSSIIGIDATTKQRVEIPKSSRLRGLYIIGAPGTGKSGLIENLIIQDIEQDIGVCLLDPHGDLTYAVLARLPDRRVKDVIFLDIANYHYPFGVNLFACSDLADPAEIQRTVDHVYHVFEKLFAVSRDTPLILQYLRNSAHTLVANPGYTMADIPLLLTDKNCRQQLLANVKSPQVRLFWRDYDNMPASEQRLERGNILRRVEEFLQDLTFPIVGQAQSTLNMRFIMDERKILLVKLDPRLEMVTSLIGSLLIALILNAAYSRADLPLEKRKQFNLYADEFQRFATEDFGTLFTEARKFGIALTVAHQMRDQLDRQNRSATVNVANLVVFKVSSPDADELAGEFDCSPSPGEPRIEYKRTPVTRPIDYILAGRSHPNKLITTFFLHWSDLSHTAHTSIREDEPDTVKGFRYRGGQARTWVEPGRKGNEAEVRSAMYTLELLNAYLHRAMLEKNPFIVLPADLFCIIAKDLELPFLKKDIYVRQRVTDYCQFTTTQTPYSDEFFSHFSLMTKDDFTYEPSEHVIAAYNKLWEVRNEKLQEAFAEYEAQARSVLTTVIREAIHIYFSFIYKLINRQGFPATNVTLRPNFQEIYNAFKEDKANQNLKYLYLYISEAIGVEEKEKELGLSQLYIPFEQLTYERIARQERFEKEIYTFYSWHLTPGTLEALPIEQYVQQEVDHIVSTMKPLFETFVRELREVARALAEQPIEDISGVVEEVTGIQRTYADMQNEIASKIVKLDQYTARVKIASDNTTSEHIIQTLNPKKEGRLGDAALNKRIADIQAQNIQDGYVRERTQVEEEIRQRQEQCSKPPGSPALLEPLPEPPGSPRRKKIT